MPLIQTLICQKAGVTWTSDTTGDTAHQVLINDIDLHVSAENLTAFQQAYASTENVSFSLVATIVDGKLHLTREWGSDTQYNSYKAAISDVEDAINAQLEAIGWTFEETTQLV